MTNEQVEALTIERDEQMCRDYIPLPGGWEIQTKGNGSTMRILDKKADERFPMALPNFVIAFLERMAREVHAECSRLHAENLALRADAERLDFVEAVATSIADNIDVDSTNRWKVETPTRFGYGGSLRMAIDRARGKQ